MAYGSQNDALLVINKNGGFMPTPGDSGGGVFADAPSPAHYPLATFCSDAAPPPVQGERALMGVVTATVGNAENPDEAAIVPTFLEEHGAWIVQKILYGRDNDPICDEWDDCPTVYNPGDQNTNGLAEVAWGSYKNGLGRFPDACDEAPTPALRLGATMHQVFLQENARSIKDGLFVTPVLKQPWGDLGAAGPENDSVQPKFCMCREADGTPINNTAQCGDPPYHCDLNPTLAELKEGATQQTLPDDETTWHDVSTKFDWCWLSGGSCFPATIRGASFPITYPGSEQLLAAWDYAGDNQRWIASGFFGEVPPTPGYPAGTDLGGALWMHGRSTRGNVQHGLGPGPCILGSICSIADDYVFGVGPDVRTAAATGGGGGGGGDSFMALPIDFGTDTKWEPDPAFAGEQVGDPVPIVTIDPASLAASYWLVGAQRAEATDVLTPALRASFTDSSVRWVAASEAATNTQVPALGRAVLIAADGTSVVGRLERSATGFWLAAGDWIPGPQVPPSVAELAAAEGPSPRSGFGAAYSRLSDFVAIIGGRLGDGAPARDLWVQKVQNNGPWTRAEITGDATLAHVEAAAFSWRDERLWVVEQVPGSGKNTQRRLVRIDPVYGHVFSIAELSSLADHDDVWLRTLDDGRVLLAAAKGSTHLLAILSSKPFTRETPKVDDCRMGGGQLLTAPFVPRLRVSGAVVRKAGGKRRISPEQLADFGDGKKGSACGLTNDLK